MKKTTNIKLKDVELSSTEKNWLKQQGYLNQESLKATIEKLEKDESLKKKEVVKEIKTLEDLAYRLKQGTILKNTYLTPKEESVLKKLNLLMYDCPCYLLSEIIKAHIKKEEGKKEIRILKLEGMIEVLREAEGL